MIHTKHSALKSLKPSSEYAWVGFDYSNLNWISSDPKPTEKTSILTPHQRATV